jgi:hypothetical protein
MRRPTRPQDALLRTRPVQGGVLHRAEAAEECSNDDLGPEHLCPPTGIDPLTGRPNCPYPPLPQYHTVDATLSSATWAQGRAAILRLPYKSLDPNAPQQMQGLIIAYPQLVSSTAGNHFLKHIEEVMNYMEINTQATSATEGTGEAAAALAMVADSAITTMGSFKMLWGFHCHRGAGIDQIWHAADPTGRYNKGFYMIIEAKGVGAALNHDPHLPPPMQTQFSNFWIEHHLVTMTNGVGRATRVAQQIMTDVGLTKMNPAPYPNYGGASKTYYGCTHNQTNQHARLYKVVVTAKWKPNNAFWYSRSQIDVVH